jgi:hypothetical protein
MLILVGILGALVALMIALALRPKSKYVACGYDECNKVGKRSEMENNGSGYFCNEEHAHLHWMTCQW